MKCPNCGQENREIARFCQYCGQELISAPGPEAPEPKGAHGGPPGIEEEDALVEPGAEEAQALEQPEEPLPIPAAFHESQEPECASGQLVGAEPEAPHGSQEAGRADVQIRTADTIIEVPEQGEPAGDEADKEVALDVGCAGSAEEALTGEEADGAIDAEGTDGEEPEGAIPTEVKPKEGPMLSPVEPAVESVDADAAAAEVQELADADLAWTESETPWITLAPGTVVKGRYQVVDVIEHQKQQALYRVRDLQRCPKCGFAEHSPDEAFCASCGAAMDQKPEAVMLERIADTVDAVTEAEPEDEFSEAERFYWVWRKEKKTGPLGGAEEPMRLVIGQRSDTGRVRALNEDSTLALVLSSAREAALSQIGLFVVADGMGGHEAGEVASQIAIRAFGRVVMEHVLQPELEGQGLTPHEIHAWMRKAMETANDQVYLERQKRDNDMGTTVTAAVIVDWALYLAHVGDCRAYRWGEAGLEQLTTDHSIVASMVAAGTAQPDEVYTHPQRSVIYRCIGDRPTVDVDLVNIASNPGDRIVLCSDGLWEMVRDEGIEEVMLSEPDPQTACDVLVHQANLAGGVDNISVIVVQL